MNDPKDISLVQMDEGYVAISPSKGDITLDPSQTNATHLKVYLSPYQNVSNDPNAIGSLHATLSLNSPGGMFFTVPKGWFGYVTLRCWTPNPTPYESNETQNTDQIVLQMFEKVLPGYNIIHFFHDRPSSFPTIVQFNRTLQYAIGFRQTDNAVYLFSSSDYFTSSQEVYHWPAGVIDNGGVLTFYIDALGYMYVANRPSALISTDGGSTWTQLPWSFKTPANAQIIPFWNITEDETTNFILFSENGTAPNGPHHRVAYSWDQNRQPNTWTTQDLDENGGQYRRINGYHINPYDPNIHFLFLADALQGQPSDGTPGFYLSQSGINGPWSTEILNQGGNQVNFNGDGAFRNGPTMVTWWPSAKAFISNGSAQRSIAAWYGNGPRTWGYPGLSPQINLLGNVDELSTWPATPWDTKAVANGYETYCATNHGTAAFNGDPNLPCHNPNIIGGQIAYTPPSVLWRYDAEPLDDGNTGNITIMAKVYWPAVPFLYLSASRGNVFPDGNFIFSNIWGGVRIPRKPVIHKKAAVGTSMGIIHSSTEIINSSF